MAISLRHSCAYRALAESIRVGVKISADDEWNGLVVEVKSQFATPDQFLVHLNPAIAQFLTG